MKERPILMHARSINGILEGRKTQTRRIIKPAPGLDESKSSALVNEAWQAGFVDAKCPFGVPGDRLWVRETWSAPHAFDGHPPRLIPAGTTFHYAATEERGGLLWRPSIHMPRWASRLTLEVTGIRVERAQDISFADCRAEGCDPNWQGLAPHPDCNCDGKHVGEKWHFRELWDDTNGKGAWDRNDWCWVVEFKRLERE